ncbi:MAG: patatin-like phospholipase family protein [Deltaproteobacteria bacterium]|nr:patatin-like phospholipase family protein [Deltaproteobacteria bacterium]
MNHKQYKILSLDGGGIRGLLTVILLQRLDHAVPGWMDNVDLIAGTSSGGITALGLAAGISLEEIRALYETSGPDIFRDSWADNIKDIGKLIAADYSNKPLKKYLTHLFGNKKLRYLKKRVLISAFDLDKPHPDPAKRSWAPKFFHNFPGKDSDGNQKVVDVAMRTSAAPTYFPTYQGYIDGGVIANNPSMAAIAQTQDKRSSKPANTPLHKITLLSIGTGTTLTRIKGQSLDWGYAQWAKHLLNIMTDGSMGMVDYQCRQILGKNYHRLCPIFPSGMKIALDDVKKIPDLIRIGEETDLRKTIRWIRTTES